MTFVVKKIDSNTELSADNTFQNPLCFTFDGIVGGSKLMQLLVENTGNAPESGLEARVINNTTGGVVTVQFGSTGDAWDNTYAIPDIPAGQSQVFWVKIDILAGQSIQVFKGIKIQVA